MNCSSPNFSIEMSMHVNSRLIISIDLIDLASSCSNKDALSSFIPIKWFNARIELRKVLHLNYTSCSHWCCHEVNRTIICSTNEMFLIKDYCLNVDFTIYNLLCLCCISTIPLNNKSILRSRIKLSPSFSHSKTSNNSNFTIQSLSAIQLGSLLVPEFNMFESKSNEISVICPNSSKYFI